MLESDTSVYIWAEECMLKVNTSTWEDLLVKRACAAREDQYKISGMFLKLFCLSFQKRFLSYLSH